MATLQSLPRKRIMATYFIGFLYLGMSSAITGPTVPYLADQVGVALDTYSYLFLIGSLGGILGSTLGARSFDRWAGHKILGWAILTSAILKFLIPLTTSFWWLFPIMFLIGFSHITFDTGGNTLLIWTWGDKVGPYMNTMHFMFGLGAIISPLVVGLVLDQLGGINWAYWTVALFGIPLSIVLFLLPSPTIPTQENEERKTISKPQLRLIWLFFMIFVLYVGAEVGFGNWVYSYAVSSKLVDPINAAYLNSLFWGGLTLGRLISIPLSRRFKTEQLLWVSVLGSIMSGLLMLLIPESIWVGPALLGLMYASFFPLTLTWAASHIHISGKVNGWLFTGANLGALIFPWLIGQLFVAISPTVLIWTILLIGICLGIMMLVVQAQVHNMENSPLSNR